MEENPVNNWSILASKCLGDYYRYCSLVDETGHVTEASMKRFEALFWPNAKVVNDIGPDPSQIISVTDYVSIAYNLLSTEGIKREWTARVHDFNPSQDSVNLEAGFRRFEMRMNKTLKNGYDHNQKSIEYPVGYERKIAISITIDVSPEANKAMILSILPVSVFQKKRRNGQ